MTTPKKAAEATPESSGDPKLDAALAEVQDKVNADNAKGYVGSTPDDDPYGSGLDNTLLTGPDGPPLVPDNHTRVAQPPAHLED